MKNILKFIETLGFRQTANFSLKKFCLQILFFYFSEWIEANKIWFSGLIIKLKIFDPLPGGAMFDDDAYFALPEEVSFDEERAIRIRLGGQSRDGYELAAGKGLADRNNL